MAAKIVKPMNHNYPFGTLFAESTDGTVQKYKYNGKELDTTNNLQQQIRYENEINFEQASGTHITTGEKTYITEKSGYVPKGSIENIYISLNDGRYNLPATVNRFKIEYTTDIIVKVLNFIQPLIGYHDMRIPTVYPTATK